MNDHETDSEFTIAEDPVLDQLLASLGHFAPEPGFDDRVMLHVIAPDPRWRQIVRARLHALTERRWGWPLLRGLTAASAFSITAIAILLIMNAAAVGESVDRILAGVGLPLWRGVLGLAAEAAHDLTLLIYTVSVSASALLAAGTSIVLLLAFNSWAIYRLMQPVGAKGVKSDAPR